MLAGGRSVVDAQASCKDIESGSFCRHCGAWRGAFGLEPTYQLFVDHAVEIFREVHRVLRADGTLWLNIGDSYATGTGKDRKPTQTGKHGYWENPVVSQRINGTTSGLKPKDLCGIPWRVAFALQADGWWLRQDIIWAKPNPMPESVTDRCTKAHEYLFLLTKEARYYYDAEAVREPAEYGRRDTAGDWRGAAYVNQKGPQGNSSGNGGRTSITGKHPETGRNRRSVWEVATAPFSEAHFATFPPALIEPCILAGTSEKGCCAKCGAPWVRQVEKSGGTTGKSWHSHDNDLSRGQRGGDGKNEAAAGWKDYQVKTIGWKPSCLCCVNDICRSPVACKGFGHCRQPYIEGEWPAPVPCTVLDPFGGAGTTGLVADRLQRNAILIELNPTYAEMAERRIHADAPLFAQAAESV